MNFPARMSPFLAPLRLTLAVVLAALPVGAAPVGSATFDTSQELPVSQARAALGAQAWDATFDGRGLALAAHDGAWRLGLELARFGFESSTRDVAGESCAHAEGRRTAFQRDEGLTEWYVSRPHGLEHGFTLTERPAGEGALLFQMRVHGDVTPHVRPDARGVDFRTARGACVLAYAGLTVFDAEGRVLPSGIEVVADGFRILVDERDARYPITVDPVFQQAYLKASNTDANDQFGWAVAVSGETIVVGAYGESSNATGVGGDEADDSLLSAGAAYVFVRTAGAWTQQAYLKASNSGDQDQFGAAVAISGDTIVVGAPAERSGSPGVNGNQADNSVQGAGAAYVFVRNGATWTQQAYLKSPSPSSLEGFGDTVAISGDTIAIGSKGEGSNATGVNGNHFDNSAPGSGAAYVFVRNGTTWTQQAYIKASNTGAVDSFGIAVGLDGDTLAVGASGEWSAATGVNGNQASNAAAGSGAAYVFTRTGTTWTQQAYVKASNTQSGDAFGRYLSLDGDRLAVGAPSEASNATGVNGNQANNLMLNAGAVYVFKRSATTWAQEAYVKASNTGVNDFFSNVSLSGNRLAVVAGGESSGSAGVDGNPFDESMPASGAAYLFRHDGSSWSQVSYIKASNPGDSDLLFCPAMSGSVLVLGAFDEDSDATGVNGDQLNNAAPGAGAAYAFDLADLATATAFCFGDGTSGACPCGNNSVVGQNQGCVNSSGLGSQLVGTGVADVSADSLVLDVSNLPVPPIAPSFVLFFQGTASTSIPFADGRRCVGGSQMRLAVRPYGGSTATYPGVLDPSVSVRGLVPVTGGVRYYQAWHRDVSLPCGSNSNLSNALSVTWVP